jgi:ribonuclease HI
MIGMWHAYTAGVRIMLVQTDCMAVVDVINGSTTPGQKRLREILREALAAHMPDIEISAKHVKGHTTNEDARSWVNRWCDFHAGRHMRVERSRRMGPKKKKRKNPDTERFKAAMLRGNVNAPRAQS